MAQDRRIYGEVENKADLKEVFSAGVAPAAVKPATQTFAQVVEVPEAARNVQFHAGTLPERYRTALQHVR